MKLSTWAKLQGLTYRTAWNLFKNDKLPVKATQLTTGTILVTPEVPIDKIDDDLVDIYGRVSSREKKNDLNSQISLCEQYCIAKGYRVRKIHKEIASGMNDDRKKLNSIFDNPPKRLVVLHKDRLTRFGFNYISKLLATKGCKLEVINEYTTEEEDLLKDFIAVITSFCCRLYGARRGQSKSLKMKEELLAK